MKFCYCDESGTGNEPYAIMAAVLVDGQRMHVTKADWAKLMEELSGLIGRRVDEFHTADFYSGNGPWRAMKGSQRTEAVRAILRWLDARSHQMIVTSVDKGKFKNDRQSGDEFSEINSPWVSMAFHAILTVQKAMQVKQGVKGSTLFFFDKKGNGETDLINLVKSPPQWSDQYYSRKKKDSALSCVIDVPHFVDSKHVPMVQVADLAAFYVRRYCELESGHSPEKYDGERSVVSECVGMLKGSLIPASAVYVAKGASPSAQFFNKYGVGPVLDLYRK